MMSMRSGLFLPVFDETADPAVVARLSVGGAEIDWDQPGHSPYDRSHAVL